MDLSGIIFVVLAFAWAAYLIPKAVKHHDEVASTRSVERFSTAMRVLARREPVDPRNARLVVTPPRSTERVLAPERTERPAEETSPAPAPPTAPRSVAARRAAARVAARRRRRVLLALLVLDLVVAGLAAAAVVPWWATAVPAALTVLFLVLCRRQVARESASVCVPRADATGPARRAVRVDARYLSGQQASVTGSESDDSEDTVQIPVEELETVAVSVETDDGGSLWDPLPVTLPTYVNKARAARTVRTIDLSAPGSWSSGRDEADAALVEQAFAPEPAEEEVEPEPRKAVGS